jgi:hypothetical protein
MRTYRTRICAAAVAAILPVMLAAAVQSASAATRNDFAAARAKAAEADAEAAGLRNQWTSTAATLKAADARAEANDFDEAVRLAVLAGNMARRSVEQAKEQATAWPAAAIGAGPSTPHRGP